MEYIVGIFIVFYALTFLYLTFWLFVSNKYSNKGNNNYKVTLLIPVRNEEENVKNLIKNIEFLSYPFFEVILVNDHSEDNTFSIIQNNLSEKVKIFNLPETCFGKKEAIKYGLQFCSGDWIVFTDADTFFQKSWINSLSKYFFNNDIVIAPVLNDVEHNKFSFIKIFEYLDAIAMQGISYATTKAGFPFLVSGANMAVRKEIALELYDKINTHIASGDDVFLLHEYLKSGKRKVAFASEKESIVFVNTQKDWLSFFKQRMRWASKVKYYKLPTALFFSFLIYVVHFLPLIWYVLGLCCININYKIFLLVLSMKFLVDVVFIFSLKSIWNIPKKYILYFPIVWLVYFAYISILPIIAMFTNINWKNRYWK